MKQILLPGVLVGLLAACNPNGDSEDAKPANDQPPAQGQSTATTAQAETGAELGAWGVETGAMNTDVDAGDDFYRYVNGTWIDSYELKPDEVRYGAFVKLRDRSEERVKAIIEEVSGGDPEPGTVEQKVADYYNTFMDLDARNERGIEAIRPELDRIAAIGDREALMKAFGRTGLDGTIAPIDGYVSFDRKNPDRHMFSISHSGLGLPDRDYYLNEGERFEGIRAAYQDHIATMLQFNGVSEEDAQAQAEAVMALETAIAEQHWPREELRNRDKTYNIYTLDTLQEEFPDFAWSTFFTAGGIDPETLGEVNVSTPSAIEPLAKLIAETDLDTFKAYLTYHTISNHAGYLSEEIDQANFAFYGTTMSGREQQRDLWKRAVSTIGSRNSLGEAIGQIYVERHFPPEAKAQAEELVENIRAAYRQRIADLDWMGEETKKEAFRKLEAFNPKIGYPNEWQDLSAIEIVPDDLMANVRAVRTFFYQDQIDRLDEPTNKDEWFMTPQTVNAYYNPSFNEIVFPAAILQPPFFDPKADMAVNYAAIGGVIGHEMGHGFDDQGSKVNADGVQQNWWTDEDRERFEARTQALVEQYNQFEPIEGEHVNGQLTLGENIGDLGGLSVAYTAYQIALDGKEAPVIDGYTGDQRFFMSWGQVWRSKQREQMMLQRLKSDPHSPPQYRVNGIVRNVDAWYDAFGVTEDDALYLPPEERVSIW
ncbi:peptidase M13 [Rhodothalassium salexigens]|uniref:M13 family metallopeptidase n=1 Tax=Rhodothalassium salexigens TaxID=1086 RepID=UPI001913DB88|nr:M13 family metallopeptidase [Rhodothalassium salexigens]MBK5919775.1 peptidase M13 [Rhodothalassium salexigens]